MPCFASTPGPAGIVPVSNSRLPVPSRTGNVHRSYSSTRSSWISVWSRPQLPETWISPLSSFFSSATASGTSPGSIDLFHSTLSSVVEATYLGTRFTTAATISSLIGLCQVEPAEALRVGQDVDLDDPPACHGDAHDGE